MITKSGNTCERTIGHASGNVLASVPGGNTRSLYRQAAFTLIELMIVIVILGLLATIIMPKMLHRPEQARRVKAKLDIKNIESALSMFNADTGRFPTTSEGLAALVKNPGIKGYNPDGYLDRIPIDPWGHPYIYICPSTHGKYYDLLSYGKDGEKGGTGDDADITNWDINE